jgi:hypothetical protein
VTNLRKWDELSSDQHDQLVRQFFMDGNDARDQIFTIIHEIQTVGEYVVRMSDIKDWWEDFSLTLDDDELAGWIGLYIPDDGRDEPTGGTPTGA